MRQWTAQAPRWAKAQKCRSGGSQTSSHRGLRLHDTQQTQACGFECKSWWPHPQASLVSEISTKNKEFNNKLNWICLIVSRAVKIIHKNKNKSESIFIFYCQICSKQIFGLMLKNKSTNQDLIWHIEYILQRLK